MNIKIPKLCFMLCITIFSGSAICDEVNYTIIDDPLYLTGDGNSIGCNPYTEYYQNGRIKTVGCQGVYHGNGTSIGMVYEYSEDGRLMRTTYYHPDEYGKDYQIIRDYDQNGNITSEAFFNNDALYEVDKVQLDKEETLQKIFKGERLYDAPH